MHIHMSKIHNNAGNWLDFSKNCPGSMPQDPLAWIHACGARLLPACGACPSHSVKSWIRP